MSSIINYLNSWWWAPVKNSKEGNADDLKDSKDHQNPQELKSIERPIIKPEDLLKVKLRKVNLKHPIVGTARNMPPISKFRLHMLTKDHLEEILNVKLKHVENAPKKRTFVSKHPVLRELKQKVPLVN